MPAGWQTAIEDWPDHLWKEQAEPEGGACEYHFGALYATREQRGVTGCTGPQTTFTDVALAARVSVLAGCGVMWVRTGAAGYVLLLCDRVASLHRLTNDAPGGANELGRWTLPSRPEKLAIGVLARGETLSVFAGETLLGTVVDAELEWGRVNVGASTGTGVEAQATFSEIRAWQP